MNEINDVLENFIVHLRKKSNDRYPDTGRTSLWDTQDWCNAEASNVYEEIANELEKLIFNRNI